MNDREKILELERTIALLRKLNERLHKENEVLKMEGGLNEWK